MTFFEQCITIALCILASVLTRALPFLFLTGNKPAPPLVRYLGNVLPAAVFGMLVVFLIPVFYVIVDRISRMLGISKKAKTRTADDYM